MDEKGILEIKLDEVTLSSEDLAHKPDLQPGLYSHLSVTDNGCGMDQKMIDNIFVPFFTTKETGVGTGLGLSVIHGIVESHGGMITVESEPGKGTTFHVFFPKVYTEGIQEEKVSKQSPRGNERILFTDDEEMLAEMGGKMLERLGYQVTFTTSSNYALETFKSNPDAFDLVITDQTMPNMSGVELAEELMKTKPDIPIILCTGYSRKVSEDKAKKLGIREFLLKPIDTEKLATTIRKVLDANTFHANS
jgi:CheY-like chemotaxis protein